MRILAVLSFCGFLAIALAQHVLVQVEDIVNDFIKPNDGLFSNVVEQFGIVSFSPTPSATTSVRPTTSPSASVHPSVSAMSSPLASGSALLSLAPSPSPLPSASPSSSKSPMPSSESRRPSSLDTFEPSAPLAAASVTPSASATSTPTPSASSSPSPSPSVSLSPSPSPSPSCIVQVEDTDGIQGSLGSPYSDFSSVASAGALTGITVGAGGAGLSFETTTGALTRGPIGANDPSLVVPSGETVQTAVVCGNPTLNYIRFVLSNGQSVESGTQPASRCKTVNAPPGAEILGSFGLFRSGRLAAIRFFTRTTC